MRAALTAAPPARRGAPAAISAVGGALLGLPAAAASPAELRAAIGAFNAAAEFPLPTLTDKHLQQLIAGEVVRIIDQPADPNAPRRATGLLVSAAPRDAVWVACQDQHFPQSSEVRELRLRFTPPDRAVWYGLVDLPRPFADRHWVVESWNNHALARATGGRAWEHPWRERLEQLPAARDQVLAGKVKGVDVAAFDGAVATPANSGAWVAVALPDGTSLFGYHATTVIGGNVPEALMLRYVHATLEGTLRTIEARAREVIPGHYAAAHAPVIGGDGEGVPAFPR